MRLQSAFKFRLPALLQNQIQIDVVTSWPVVSPGREDKDPFLQIMVGMDCEPLPFKM